MGLNETQASLPRPLPSPVNGAGSGQACTSHSGPVSVSVGFKLGMILVSLGAIVSFCQITWT